MRPVSDLLRLCPHSTLLLPSFPSYDLLGDSYDLLGDSGAPSYDLLGDSGAPVQGDPAGHDAVAGGAAGILLLLDLFPSPAGRDLGTVPDHPAATAGGLRATTAHLRFTNSSLNGNWECHR